MPFGGHQQICSNKIISRLPFIHLLPDCLYTTILRTGGEDEDCIRELLEIKRTRTSVELFERLAGREKMEILDRRLYFINPHYEVKFGLKLRLLSPLIASIPNARNFAVTSCFYLLKPFGEAKNAKCLSLPHGKKQAGKI
jgi:hypothetical protein